MEQSGLSAYADAGERPAAEAKAVAGNGGSRADEVIDLDERRFPPTEETVEIGITQVNYTVEETADGERPSFNQALRVVDDLLHGRCLYNLQ